MEPDELLRSLISDIEADRAGIEKLDRYYEGEQPLQFLAPDLQEELGDRITQMVINWPRLGTDAYENRLDVEGFRYAGDTDADQALWDVWQANNMVEESGLAHLDALIFGRSYVIVGPGDSQDDPSIITVEHPLQVITRADPRTRRTVAAVKHWRDDDMERTRRATLYLPGQRIPYVMRNGWQVDGEPVDTGIDEVPVVPLLNRRRILRMVRNATSPDFTRFEIGTSEFKDVIRIADGANKMATDMMVSGEFHASPRRWVLGMTEEDFVDERTGQKVSGLSAIIGRLWGFRGNKDDVSVGQFPEANLENFHATLRVLAQVAAQMLGLAPHHMAFSGENPASADAIRSSETIQVKRAERKQVGFGGSWEQVQRLQLKFSGAYDDRARNLETQWRNPATPTVAQQADATVKLVQAGVITVAQGRRDLGYTPEQIARMEQDETSAARRELLPFVQPAEPAA